MKKTIAMLAFGLCAGSVLAGADNFILTFSTVGPDKYADGKEVVDGETYALVWTPEGEAFGGFSANGEATGGSKVLIKAPVAEQGRCPRIQLQVDEAYLKDKGIQGGTWGVYLLDTRKYATEDVSIEIDGQEIVQKQLKIDNGNKIVSGVGGAVQGWGFVTATVDRQFGSGTAGVATAGNPSAIQPPKIVDFKVRDGMAYLYLENGEKGVSYGAAAGATPGALSPTKDAPVCADESGKFIVVTPAKGASGFYTGIVR